MKNPIKYIYKYIIANVQFYRAKRLADSCHELDGDRYYVISTVNRKLVVGNRIDLRKQDYMFRKSKGVEKKTKNLTVVQLEKGCYYCTPYRDEVHGRLSIAEYRTRKRAFIDYVINK